MAESHVILNFKELTKKSTFEIWHIMSSTAEKSKSFDRTLIDGPIPKALWKLAWPTMLQNIIGGLQGIIDHAMVGNFVGYTGNAAIGVSIQIFIVVIVFIMSLYSGMGVLVARLAGAGDHEKVNRTVYQAYLTSLGLSVGILAPLGWVLSPYLLDIVHATPEVQAQALPYLRIMFVFSFGMMMFFRVGGALRSAGDARTPLRLGIVLTVLNVVLNVILIPGLGAIPPLAPAGVALGDGLEARLGDHPLAVPVRPPHRVSGGGDERRRCAAPALHRIAGAEC